MTERLAESATAASLVGALDELDLAVVITDALADIRFANQAAERLLAGGDRDRDRRGRKLAACDREADRALRDAIFAQAGEGVRTGRANVAIPRRVSGVGLQATICPPAVAGAGRRARSSPARGRWCSSTTR